VIVGAAILVALSTFMAWRYARMAVDPDLATYLLPATTDAVYGKDFVDCKTPAIYAWFYFLRGLVGQNVERIMFANHVLIGAGGGLLVLWLTGDFWKALTFTILISSGWLLAFHGNVGQIPAVLLVVALAAPSPWVAATAGAVAVLFEPKLLLCFIAMVAIYRWWIPAAVLAAVGVSGAATVRLLWPKAWGAIWESSVVLPMRVKKNRARVAHLYNWVPSYTAVALLYFLPWLVFGVWGNPTILYWLPATLYLLVAGAGVVLRPNHFLPLVAWVALAQTSPQMVFALTLIDWTAGGFYLGNLWVRFYPALAVPADEMRKIGLAMRDRVGGMWVNGMWSTCVYVYSGKKPLYGMTENIELSTAAVERRHKMKEAWRTRPAEWVVETPVQDAKFTRNGYTSVSTSQLCSVWHRDVPAKG